jgi:hypothetical protein
MKAVWERFKAGWMRFAHVVGVFNTKLIFTLFYYLLLLPFGVAMRFFADPLKVRMTPKNSNWLDRETRDRTLADLQKQS